MILEILNAICISQHSPNRGPAMRDRTDAVNMRPVVTSIRTRVLRVNDQIQKILPSLASRSTVLPVQQCEKFESNVALVLCQHLELGITKLAGGR